jgi:alkylation response protein AidB-like acyl-CoA dehydrogenase
MMDFFYKMNMKDLGKKFAENMVESLNDKTYIKTIDHKCMFLERWNICKDFGIFDIIELFKNESKDYWNDIVSLMYGIGLGSNNLGIMFSVNVQLWACILPIKKFSNSNTSLLKQLSEGEKIGAHAISENTAGSDVFNIVTEYEYDSASKHYILNGGKIYVTNAPYADIYLVYARKKGTVGYNNISCFLIDSCNPCFYIGETIQKMGMEYSPMASIYMEKCIVSEKMLLGHENQGYFIFNYVMIHERVLLLAFQIGLMKSQFDRNVKFCKQRKQGGVPIIKYQSISNRLADMKVNIEACELFLKDIVTRLNGGKMTIEASSIFKLFISEKLVENTFIAIKNYGTFGYTKECEAEENLRDSIGSLFYSGTSDIQRNIISSFL